MNSPIPFLKKGDKIKLVSPAKSIEPVLVFEAKEFWEKQGFIVEIGEFCVGKYHYFSGSDEERLKDFQEALDDPEIKAIICNRGGYGCVRILDSISWDKFKENPKWIVGFSDVTVFHLFLQSKGIQSIHATMPLNYGENSQEALSTLVESVTGQNLHYNLKSNPKNISGKTNGILLGGNLSIIYSLLGTDIEIDYSDKILFIEDLSEQFYHIDRMFFALKKAGVLAKIKGLIVGSFTSLKDTEIPYGKNLEEIVLEHTKNLNIPVAFDFPAGHIDDNRALIFGKEINLEVGEKEVLVY